MIKAKDRHEQVNSNRRGVVSSFADVIGDIASLAELQFELFKIDCSASSRKLLRALALATIGLLLLAGAIPVALLALSAILYEFAGLNAGAAMGIAVATCLAIASIFVAIAFWIMKSSATHFQRSRRELKQNINWLKGLKNRKSRTQTNHHN